MIAPVLIALALAAFLIWQAYVSGHASGFWEGSDVERDRLRGRFEAARGQRDAAEAALSTQREASDKLVAHCARQRLRLRGTLREARRWKSVALGLGWRRAGATPGCRACGSGCVDCALKGAMRAIAAGLSVPPRRRWTTVADVVPVAPPPEPVRPTMVILPPQESADAAEKLAASVRQILGEAADAGGGA